MVADAYFLVVNGKPQGPFTSQQLLHRNIMPNSYLKKIGMDDYKQAHEIEEIRILLHFKPQFTTPQYFAGFDLRLLSTAIDWFIIIGATLILDLLIVILSNSQSKAIEILIYSFFLVPVFKFIYQIVMEIKWQATVGKMLLNIKVTDLGGQRPKNLTIIIRNLSKIISTALFLMGYLYSFANKKQQCLHDVFAHTLVIKARLI